MAVVKRRRRSTGRDEAGQRIVARPERGALAIFAALLTLAPLAFGAVDQVVQAALLLLFAAGLALRPPSIARPSARTNRLLIALAAVLVLKEFAPAALFGSVQWRTILTRQFGLELPWTHHPEPGRAVDALLSAGARGALVSLGAHARRPARKSRLDRVVARRRGGHRGGGQFPDAQRRCARDLRAALHARLVRLRPVSESQSHRLFSRDGRGHGVRHHGLGNHAAAYHPGDSRRAAGAAFAGRACWPRNRAAACSRSARGCAIYGGFCLAKFRNRRALALIATIALVGVTVALAGGHTLFARFSAESTEDSNSSRVAIWGETLHLWADAPLFGHGAGCVQLGLTRSTRSSRWTMKSVLHPESSWLQWLAEMGAVPVLLAALLAGGWLVARARMAHASQRSFFLYAAGFATFGALLCHGAVDVPAHRWATAAFALGRARARLSAREADAAGAGVGTPGAARGVRAARGARAAERRRVLVPAAARGLAGFVAAHAATPAHRGVAARRLVGGPGASAAVVPAELGAASRHRFG